MLTVKKRDGAIQPLDENRIFKAIHKAANSVSSTFFDINEMVGKVIHKFEDRRKPISIIDIQNQVEHVLLCSSHKDVAKAYINYRHDRDVARESHSKLLKNIDEFLSYTDDDLTKENANKDAKSVSTHRDLFAGMLSKHIAVRHLLPGDVSSAHNEGFIHIHDLDYFLSPLTNCMLVNYRDMLDNGFRIGDAEIGSPNSIGVASTVLTQIIQAVASSQYGGQTIAHMDIGLAKYVKASHQKLMLEQEKYDLPHSWVTEKLEKEVYDAMQAFLYQVNTLTTTNGQSPFISISIGSGTGYCERLITKKYLEVHMAGLGKDKITPVFPKVIFMLEDGVSMRPGDINYDLKKLSIECSVQRIYPDYLSVPLNREVTGSTGTAVSPMGCRSFLPKYVNEEGSEVYDGRFNMGVVSLNLAMIAKESTPENFYENLGKYSQLALKAHMIRVARLKGTTARQNPTLFMHGAISRLAADDTIDQLFYDGYASISLGFIGMAEAVSILGYADAKEKSMEILKYLKGLCDTWKKETRLGFSLYATPSEGYALRAATCFKKRYGEDSLDRDYLTNSFHQPVWENSTPIEKWQHEQGFAALSTGGHIAYIEEHSLKNNLEAYESYVDLAYKMHPYFGINTPVDKCFKCGFTGEFTAAAEGYTCPTCGNKEEGTISVVRRVSGYLTAPNSRPLNRGKQQEVMQRVKHE